MIKVAVLARLSDQQVWTTIAQETARLNMRLECMTTTWQQLHLQAATSCFILLLLIMIVSAYLSSKCTNALPGMYQQPIYHACTMVGSRSRTCTYQEMP